jgi:drug/metabolite transporter (DMT)-like permease
LRLSRPLAIAGVVVLMIVWGSTFVVTKAAVRDIPPLTLATLRFAIATLTLLPIVLWRGGLSRLPKPFPLAPLLWMSLTGTALFTAGFNLALLHGSAVQGSLIYAFVPAAVAIAAVIALKEKVSRRRTIGIALSVGGVALVAAGGQAEASSPHPLLGAMWMLITVVVWAIYTVIAKRLANADQLVVITCISAIGTLMLLPFAAFELMQSPREMPSMQAWIGAAYLGSIAGALAYLVYNIALRVLDASLVGALSNLDPIVGVVTAVIFLGESLDGWQMIGGLVALAGMWLAS